MAQEKKNATSAGPESVGRVGRRSQGGSEGVAGGVCHTRLEAARHRRGKVRESVISSTPHPTSKRANAYTVKHPTGRRPNGRGPPAFAAFAGSGFRFGWSRSIAGLAMAAPPISFPLLSVIRPLLLPLLLPVALALGDATPPENLFEQQFSLQVFQTDDGLPHNVAISVLQRPDGYLWVATNGGLAQFDGVQFR